MATDVAIRGVSGLQSDVCAASTAPTAAQQAAVVSISPNTPALPLLPTGVVRNGFYPNPINGPIPSNGAMLLNQYGTQDVRAAVETDEGSFNDDFPGAALTTALAGTITTVSGSVTVTGSGTNFLSLKMMSYIKLTSDSETAYAQIATVQSNTSLTLTSGYTGSSGSGAGINSNWSTVTPAGGSIGVGSSLVTIGSGTTSGAWGGIARISDTPPLKQMMWSTISQRIANQNLFIGYQDTLSLTPTRQAGFLFTGTVNTVVNCVTTIGADTTSQTVTLPANGTTATAHNYQTLVTFDLIVWMIDGVVVATQQQHILGPYDLIGCVAYLNNTGTAASNTNLVVDQVTLSDYNSLEVQPVQMRPERLNVTLASADATTAITSISAANANLYSGVATANSSLALAGVADMGYSMVIEAISSPVLTLLPQFSMDGGITWKNTFFIDITTGKSYQVLNNSWPAAFAAGQAYSIATTVGVSHVRISCSPYSSGSLTVQLRSNDMHPQFVTARNQTMTTYEAIYQLAAATSISLTKSVAAAAVQYATLYHAATAVRTVKIKRIEVSINGNTVAGITAVYLVRLTATTAPATGNPAITPTAHNTGSAAAEVTCLALPTTPGSTGSAGVGIVNAAEFNLGIVGAQTVPPVNNVIVLYDDSQGANVEPCFIRAGIAEGYAVSIASSATSTINATVRVLFTEE
jgi:hypothetical protein